MADPVLFILENKAGTVAEGWPFADIERAEYQTTNRGGVVKLSLKVWLKGPGLKEYSGKSAEEIYKRLKQNAVVVKLT